MDVTKLKKARSIQRTAFSKTLTTLNNELKKETVLDSTSIRANFAVLQQKATELFELDKKILDTLIEGNTAEEEILAEINATDEDSTKFQIASVTVKDFLEPRATQHQENNVVPRNDTANVPIPTFYKLPKIELKKFSGDIKEWLPFWSMHKKIHDDKTLTNEEKFHYLIQAMVEGTRAYELVVSYPPTAENYPKVIASLTNRFGRQDLLVEVYVRELLSLVLNKTSGTLSCVYDKLETHLRALESLGVTTAVCAAMLYPLVESALPDEILREWQRKGANSENAEGRLTNLIKFLEEEVNNEQRISLVKTGFSASAESRSAKPAETKVKNNSSTKPGVATTGTSRRQRASEDDMYFLQGATRKHELR
ncbi:hypothetical protein TKK_0016522 [Trichogramma kaykai]